MTVVAHTACVLDLSAWDRTLRPGYVFSELSQTGKLTPKCALEPGCVVALGASYPGMAGGPPRAKVGSHYVADGTETRCARQLNQRTQKHKGANYDSDSNPVASFVPIVFFLHLSIFSSVSLVCKEHRIDDPDYDEKSDGESELGESPDGGDYDGRIRLCES